jgi:hypothetical protein
LLKKARQERWIANSETGDVVVSVKVTRALVEELIGSAVTASPRVPGTMGRKAGTKNAYSNAMADSVPRSGRRRWRPDESFVFFL